MGSEMCIRDRTQSIGLAFVAYPKAISMLPYFPHLFGLLFFGILVIRDFLRPFPSWRHSQPLSLINFITQEKL